MKAKSILLTTCITLSFVCCKKDDTSSPTPPPDNSTQYALGWSANEDLSNVPIAYSSGSFGTVSLPSAVDLSQFLPPIGNQGSFGTCIAWSTGYYAKTATEAIANKYTSAQLSSLSYQTSPRDLFTAIPDRAKGKSIGGKNGCEGTDFVSAFNVLLSRGVATMTTVPYSNLGDCGQANSLTSWTSDAAKHKIAAYRTINPSISSIKEALANKNPVLFGAYISDNFYGWSSSNVLSSSTTYEKGGGHALTIVGYDDKMGVNGAFKVVNSWGTSWGSKGFIWVDYNYMLNTFNRSKSYFVITEPASKIQPTTPKTTGVDLEAWVDSDVSKYKETGRTTSRGAVVNIYNNGSSAASSQKPWKAYYFYYNAKDAKDVGLLYTYTFTTKNLATGKSACANANCEINVTIPSGGSLSKQHVGTDNGA